MTNMSCPSPQLVIPQTPELYTIQSRSLKNNLKLKWWLPKYRLH
jgi:hypothetical protein